MKYIGIGLLGIAAYFVIGYTAAALHLFALPLFKLESKIKMNEKIIEKTYNADNALYNYEWFKDRYEAIGAIDTKIANAQAQVTSFDVMAGERSTWEFEDKTEYSRLNAVLLGLQNHKEDLVAEYNSRAKQVNRNIFQDNLPLFINLN